MAKILLWPGAIALILLLVIMLRAKHESAVSKAAKNVQPLGWGSYLAFVLLVAGAVVPAVQHYQSHVAEAAATVLSILNLCFAAIVLAVIVATDFFCHAAPVAAAIGEEMSDTEKKSTFRHGISWFNRFRKW